MTPAVKEALEASGLSEYVIVSGSKWSVFYFLIGEEEQGARFDAWWVKNDMPVVWSMSILHVSREDMDWLTKDLPQK